MHLSPMCDYRLDDAATDTVECARIERFTRYPVYLDQIPQNGLYLRIEPELEDHPAAQFRRTFLS